MLSFTRSIRSHTAMVAAATLAVIASGCAGDDTTADDDPAGASDGAVDDGLADGDDEPVDDDAEVVAEGSDAAGDEEPEPDASGDPVGELTIGDDTFELVSAYWCEPEESLEGGELTVRVLAQGVDEEVGIHAYELDQDNDRGMMHRADANIGASTFRSYDLPDDREEWPFLVVDGDTVTFAAELMNAGDMYDVHAEFTLPADPGMPMYC